MIQAHHILILDTSHRLVAVLMILTFGLNCDFDCRTLVNPRDSGGPSEPKFLRHFFVLKINSWAKDNVSADVCGTTL